MSAQSQSGCDLFRLVLIQRAEGGPVDVGLDLHLTECAACRRELARAERRVAFVRDLPRATAPVELDGAVVAALQAGARQSRAVRALESLTPLAAPADLARRVAAPGAPAVLERLVREDLADPKKALASRYAGQLERLRAPADLESRLGARPVRSGRRWLPVALVAAGLTLVFGSLVLTQVLRNPGQPVAQQEAQPGPVFVVVHVDSVRSLDPFAAELVSGFLGGWVEAHRIAKEEL